jgi:hypothetical protein
VVNAIETGGVPPSSQTSSAGGPGNAAIVQQVIHAAYDAFQSGLHAALYLSAGLVIVAGILAAVTLGRERSAARAEHQTDLYRTVLPDSSRNFGLAWRCRREMASPEDHHRRVGGRRGHRAGGGPGYRAARQSNSGQARPGRTPTAAPRSPLHPASR